MAKSTRAVDPDLLPHPRPCWCDDCRLTYGRIYAKGYTPKWSSGSCPTCDQPVSGSRKYCSQDCYPGGPNHSTKISYCTVCGSVFKRSKGQARPKRCPEHFIGDNNHYKPARRTSVECRWCHRDFLVTPGRAGRQITCSRECSSQLSWHHGRYGYSDRAPLPTCVVCGDLTGKPPAPRREDYGLESSTYRCASCELPPNPATNGRKNARRRRRESVKAGEKFTVHDLIERDGDRCHICDERVRFDVSHLDPDYGTIDHLWPVSDGGEHTMANAAVAHRHCNNVRGTRGEPVQPRLL